VLYNQSSVAAAAAMVSAYLAYFARVISDQAGLQGRITGLLQQVLQVD